MLDALADSSISIVWRNIGGKCLKMRYAFITFGYYSQIYGLDLSEEHGYKIWEFCLIDTIIFSKEHSSDGKYNETLFVLLLYYLSNYKRYPGVDNRSLMKWEAFKWNGNDLVERTNVGIDKHRKLLIKCLST